MAWKCGDFFSLLTSALTVYGCGQIVLLHSCCAPTHKTGIMIFVFLMASVSVKPQLVLVFFEHSSKGFNWKQLKKNTTENSVRGSVQIWEECFRDEYL